METAITTVGQLVQTNPWFVFGVYAVVAWAVVQCVESISKVWQPLSECCADSITERQQEYLDVYEEHLGNYVRDTTGATQGHVIAIGSNAVVLKTDSGQLLSVDFDRLEDEFTTE